MLRFLRFLIAGVLMCRDGCAFAVSARRLPPRQAGANPKPRQETGFLNRVITLQGVAYRFQVYLPESFRRDKRKPWPVILYLHGRGERGSEGMWQTQIGLPQAVRDHPERWPFVIVMPQCPLPSFWTDPEMLAMAMAALDQETDEFRLDPERTYLTGLSMGGYGAWELGGTIPSAGRRWPSWPAASSGAMPRSAGRRLPRCPPSTPAPSAARRSGSSMAARQHRQSASERADV
jgi:acetyl esterase/lipase